MGFFTDAYDLFVIGIVVALLQTEWHLSTTQVSLLNSSDDPDPVGYTAAGTGDQASGSDSIP